MFRLRLLQLLNIIAFVASSSILVQDGVYSRVTVQIEELQPQPENCVDFLDHLEVSLLGFHLVLLPFYYNVTVLAEVAIFLMT